MFAIRAPIAALGGATLSAAVFLGLWQLVSVPFGVQQMAEARRIDFTPQRRETPVANKRDPQVTQKPPVPQPHLPTLSGRNGDGGEIFEYSAPRLNPPVERAGLRTSGVDGDVTPIVRMSPDYPPRAAAAGTEGWVQVRFSVTTAGTVRDAAVVASEPGTTFDDAALKAIARWRYNPRVVDGVAVERVGLETLLRFELE